MCFIAFACDICFEQGAIFSTMDSPSIMLIEHVSSVQYPAASFKPKQEAIETERKSEQTKLLDLPRNNLLNLSMLRIPLAKCFMFHVRYLDSC